MIPTEEKKYLSKHTKHPPKTALGAVIGYCKQGLTVITKYEAVGMSLGPPFLEELFHHLLPRPKVSKGIKGSPSVFPNLYSFSLPNKSSNSKLSRDSRKLFTCSQNSSLWAWVFLFINLLNLNSTPENA